MGVATDDHGYSLFLLIRVQRRLQRRRRTNLTIAPDPYYLQVSSNPHPPVQYGTSLDFYPSRSVNDGLAGDVIVRRCLDVIVFGVIRTHLEACVPILVDIMELCFVPEAACLGMSLIDYGLTTTLSREFCVMERKSRGLKKFLEENVLGEE